VRRRKNILNIKHDAAAVMAVLKGKTTASSLAKKKKN
jgi:hypothetical protein